MNTPTHSTNQWAQAIHANFVKAACICARQRTLTR